MKEEDKKGSEVQFQINKVHKFQPCFETNSNIFERMFFIWTHQLIRKGTQKHLQMNDLSDLKDVQEPEYSGKRFKDTFYSFPKDTKKRLFQSFKKYLGFHFMLAGILATIANLLQFSGPLMINKVLEFLNSQDPVIEQGVIYVSILVVCYLLRTIIFQHSMHFVNLSCIKVLNSGNSLIYNKIIKLSSAARKYLETGTIMNNINVDIMSFYYFIMMSTFLFSAPLMILTAIVLLIMQVGWIGIAAPILFFIGMFFQQKLMKKGFTMRKDQLFWSDKRSKCVNQYFSGIRIIKYYGWQELVAEKIENIRKEQLNLNYKVLMIRTYVQVMMNMLPILSSIIIFAVYAAVQGQQNLTSAKVYTVLSIFNLISTPMRLVVIVLINLMNSQASLERVQHFLGYQQRNSEGVNFDDDQRQKGQIKIANCKFNWETQQAKKHNQKGKQLYNKNKKDQDSKEKKDKKDQQPKPKTKKKVKKHVVDGEKKKKKKKKKSKKIEQRKSLLTEEGSLTQSLLKDKSEQTMSSSNKSKYVLEIKELNIKPGEFITVIGKVGSGKSTLLSAILGEIDKVSGQISRRGRVAYIPQTSWLRSATIKENILFEENYEKERYDKIIKISELQQDLQILSGGDETEIGEKGVNLSGGQKQRISIARALYADSDIYLIDDCLSALDAYVGKNIFHNAIKQYLHNKGKTIVFVTNAIEYTEFADRVIVMDGGRIAQDGSPEELKNTEDSLYGQLKLIEKKSKQQQEEEIAHQKEQQAKRKKSAEDSINIKLQQQKQQKEQQKKPQKIKENQGLVKVEQRLKGSVPWKYYTRFFTGPGTGASALMFFFILLAQCSRVASDWWLGQWSNNIFQLPQNTYIWIYSVISLVVGILLYIKGVFFAKFIISTSRVVQRKLIKVLLQSPLSWFDVTPTGRILARTTKDQDDLDNSLSFNVQFAAQNIFILISSLLLISLATPLYLIVAVISGLIYYKLVGMYMSSSREIKRLQANTRAPLITHFQETINGIYVIRAFQKQKSFLDRYYLRQKYYVTSLVNQNIATRWINLMTDLFSIVTIAAAGYFGVITVAVDIGTKNSGLIGLALVWSLQISSVMSFTLRVLADTESNMNAVVRLYDYIDNNPAQKDFKNPKPQQSKWPSEGNYSVNDISYRYRPELPLVIKKISFDVKKHAKIGIVGRTGSGKSTMTLGLLRILELAENSDGSVGKISLDNQNVSELGLHHLRHKITIIPQDPTLFTGTIKQNIDPFNQYTNKQIEDCLRKVGLWQVIPQNEQETSLQRKKIYSKIDESGSNYSLGQRQLICMSRALIRHPKVLLMDQATASIDQQTDEVIQNMIRKQFNETTVITIAHRLNTIIYYDKILVLDNGQVQQYDTPMNLVTNPDTFLGKLIRKVSKQFTQKMIAQAKAGEEEKNK